MRDKQPTLKEVCRTDRSTR